MFKKIVFIFLILSLFFFNPPVLNAESQEEVQARINEYTQKLDELNKSKDTLSNQIKILNSQYELTLLKITQTENSIKNLEKEINDLSVKINNLNDQLDELSSLYVLQIIQNYKLQKNVPPFAFFFSDNLNNYLKQYKYVSNVQKASQNSLINMETIRSNYDAQKTQKAKKQQEMETLQQTLATQKKSLNSQKITKDQLLQTTKNDEKKYQQMLSEAIAQLNAFQSFVLSSGGSSLLSNQTHCDDWGCYYNQRDAGWGNIVFGYSDGKNGRTYYDMKGWGCLVTSTTMILNHYDKNVNPSDLAQNSNLFDGHTGDMRRGNNEYPLYVKDFAFYRITLGSSLSSADTELNAGRPVIAGVSCVSTPYGVKPSHFVVIKSKKDGKYIINDPYPENGYDKNLNYSVCRIDSVRLK